LRTRIAALSLICSALIITSTLRPSEGAAQGAAKSSLIQIKIHSSALEGNLLRDSADRNVAIYLPPGYARGAMRYSVIYLLHGYQSTNKDWTDSDSANVPKILDSLIVAGKIRPMIVVMPDGSNKFAGSFYTNSVATGNWEDFVTQDLVKYVDANYRTAARPSSRGIAGHSMGGYGALRLAMKHPDIYGAVYSLSACCMEWGDDLSLANPAWDKTLEFRSMDDFTAANKSSEPAAFFSMVFVALGAAWSPDPQRPPFYTDFPVDGRNGSRKPVEAQQARWSANMIVPMMSQYRSNLARLKGIAFDVGTQDEFAHIVAGARDFDKLLSANGINHEFSEYEGDHMNRIGERIESKVLPFFSSCLD
jgi:S-formylglutathione hydrolase FrmB